MSRMLDCARRKFRKQFHKYWQRSLPLRSSTLHPGFARFAVQYAVFRAMASREPQRLELSWENRLPCLEDNTPLSDFRPAFLYPLAWTARALVQNKPDSHVDLASSLEFAAMVAAFVPVRRYADVPVEISLSGITCTEANLAALPLASESVKSLSCLGVAEHQGLGRYDAKLDPDADLRLIEEIKRVLADGASLFFSAPVGTPRVLFNSHRVYSRAQIQSYFAGLQIADFAFIDQSGRFMRHATPEQADTRHDGTGCWWFRK